MILGLEKEEWAGRGEGKGGMEEWRVVRREGDRQNINLKLKKLLMHENCFPTKGSESPWRPMIKEERWGRALATV